MKCLLWIAGVLCLAVGGSALAQAPKYPVKPVRMMVGFAPGGATDIVARLLAPGLGESLGQTVVVENRPGASSQIAGELNYGTGGLGTTPHMSGELLTTQARVKIVHVPFKGEAPALIDVIAGHVPMMFSNITASIAFVQSGRLRMLAQTGLQRSAVVPDVPTMAESGLPGFQIITFFGVMAPAATPHPIVTRLNAELAKAASRPDVRKQYAAQALDPGTLTADEYAAFIKDQAVKFGKVIREAGITAR